MADSPTGRTKAFVSYNHADEVHLKRLHIHLEPYVREQKVDVWDDTRISPGGRWRDEIRAAIASAKLAILLISADFLASDFIAHDELPPLLEAAEQEGTLILPVIVSPCAFERSKLARYQALNKPSEPLISLPYWQQEVLWARLAGYVADALAPELYNYPPAPPPQASRQVLGTTLFTYRDHFSPVLAVDWSPDGRRLVSGDLVGKVQVWDAKNGKLLITSKEHTGTVTDVAWSPGGSYFASSSQDKTACIWDDKGSEIFTYGSRTDASKSRPGISESRSGVSRSRTPVS